MNLTVGSDSALAFGLLFARAGGMMLALPALLGVAVPMKVRAALTGLLAAALMPMASVTMPAAGLSGVAILVIRELGIGAILSFATAAVVGAVMTAADVIGGGMELNTGAILRGGVQVPNPLADGLGALAGLLFFVGGFHRALLMALGRSLVVAPLGAVALPDPRAMIALGGRIFELALGLGLPVIVPLFVLSLAQGVVSRLAPQVNILMAAPAAMILAGLVLLALDALGFGAGIMRAWSSVMPQAMGWVGG